jgi:hypothetical protein
MEPPRVLSFLHRRLAIESRQKKNTCGVRVEQNFPGVKSVKRIGILSRHRVRVVTSPVNFVDRDPAVPDAA